MGIDVSRALDRLEEILASEVLSARVHAVAVLDRWRHDSQLSPFCRDRANAILRGLRARDASLLWSFE